MSTDQRPTVEPTLQANAIGFTESLSIGLNATSPAYSLAAILGPLVVIVGVSAPGVLIASFIPMLLIDLLVSATLMALGMMMVPPTLVSLPLKVGIFLLADGWHLLVQSLVRSFG